MKIASVLILLALAAQAHGEEAVWDFQPPPDHFSDKAFLDLRSLNEHEAGEKGFVRLAPDGSFVLGDGTPARFWAVEDDSVFRIRKDLPPVDTAKHARFLAKHGVNFVRCLINITPTGNDITAIDEQERDVVWRLVATLKKEGIYTLLTPYWSSSSRVKPGLNGIPDNGSGKGEFKKGTPYGFLYFDPTMKNAYKSWLKALLTVKNPNTNLALGEDPSVAVIQLQNEDGLLWWTLGTAFQGESGRELSQQFGAFLKKKYGSFAAVTERWQGAALKNDDLSREAPGFMPVWDMTQVGSGGPGMDQRRSDQVEFLTELMRSFNTEMVDYVHKDLGCRQVISANNWKTADNARLFDCQRYSDSATDVIAINHYYTPVRKGKLDWAISGGDFYEEVSALKSPLGFPGSVKRVEGHPTVVTESIWMPPIQYRSEAPFLIAAYSCLTGLDCFCWFSSSDETWRQPRGATPYHPGTESIYLCNSPMCLGQFPATALMYHKAYVRKGAPAVKECRPVEDLWHMSVPLIYERSGNDPIRDLEVAGTMSTTKTKVDPVAFLVGPVSVKYGADSATSVVQPDLEHDIDHTAGEARSNTGELNWNWNDGICTINAPKAQGASGFLNVRKTIALKDVSIDCKNPYATVLAVALDDQPLATSNKILIQVGTIEHPTGWTTKPAVRTEKGKQLQGQEIVSTGKAPMQIVEADLNIVITNSKLAKLHILDASLEEISAVPLTPDAGKASITFPKNALYAVAAAE